MGGHTSSAQDRFPPLATGLVDGDLGVERRLSHAYSSDVGKEVVDESRKCPMCSSTTWMLLDGHSRLQALEGGLEALAYSCEECGFIRWHRMDKAERRERELEAGGLN